MQPISKKILIKKTENLIKMPFKQKDGNFETALLTLI